MWWLTTFDKEYLPCIAIQDVENVIKQRVNPFIAKTATEVIQINSPDKESSQIHVHHVLDLKT